MAGVYLFCLMLCSSPLAPQNCYQNPKSYAMSLVKSALKTHLGFDVRRARNFHASPGFEPAGLSPDHPNSKLWMLPSPIQVILVQVGIPPTFSPKNWRIPEPGCEQPRAISQPPVELDNTSHHTMDPATKNHKRSPAKKAQNYLSRIETVLFGASIFELFRNLGRCLEGIISTWHVG